MNVDLGKLVTSSCGKMSPDPRLNEVSSPVSGSDVPSVNFLQLEDSDSDVSPEDDGYELLNANELDSYEDDVPMLSDHVSLSHPHGHCTFEPHSTHEPIEMDIEEREQGPSSSSGKKNSVQLTPDQSEVIKSVMKTIKLPESAVPSWASVIPEEKWKSLLDTKIKGKPNSSNEKS